MPRTLLGKFNHRPVIDFTKQNKVDEVIFYIISKYSIFLVSIFEKIETMPRKEKLLFKAIFVNTLPGAMTLYLLQKVKK